MMFTSPLPQVSEIVIPPASTIPQEFAPNTQIPGEVEGNVNNLDESEIGEGVSTSSTATTPETGVLAGAVAFVADMFSASRLFLIFGFLFVFSAGYLAYFLYQKTKGIA
jgi:hypothetical protein